MAGLIRREDIDLVRERANIEDVVSEHVTLRTAGVGSKKGLCPFHDERTPSFHVRPHLGLWHCFGCSEGGDVISFIQKINHLSFTEAVEYLAGKYGVDLRYEDGAPARRGPQQGQRRRLLEANRMAEEFYRQHLFTAEGKAARDFLKERGFSKADVDRFGVGASPESWDSLIRHLRASGFTEEELVTAGLAIEGNRGLYDRFRGRVMWPIRDLTGATIGFGARRLGEDPKSPKYLNTPETPVYHKAQVLYGLDVAKKDISRQRKVVIVEGYTDVMAAHAAGETTAVATCGTAFGREHTQLIRRLLGDVADASAGIVLADGRPKGGEVIFTFDGDEAGKAAARRAYMEDQSFAAQTFVAVDPHGMDPCDLRLAGGDQALRGLIAARVPLFEFVLRTLLNALDLDSAEGRVQGLRAAAPILAGIKDQALRSEYGRLVAGWLGMDPREVEDAQRKAARQLTVARRTAANAAASASGGERQQRGYSTNQSQSNSQSGGPTPGGPTSRAPAAKPSLERFALAVALQRPLDILGSGFESLEPTSFSEAHHRAVFERLTERGSLDLFLEMLQEAEREIGIGEDSVNLASARWAQSVVDGEADAISEEIMALLLMPLPIDEAADQRSYAQGIIRALIRRDLEQRTASLQARLRRTAPGTEEYEQAFAALLGVEKKRRIYLDSMN